MNDVVSQGISIEELRVRESPKTIWKFQEVSLEREGWKVFTD